MYVPIVQIALHFIRTKIVSTATSIILLNVELSGRFSLGTGNVYHVPFLLPKTEYDQLLFYPDDDLSQGWPSLCCPVPWCFQVSYWCLNLSFQYSLLLYTNPLIALRDFPSTYYRCWYEGWIVSEKPGLWWHSIPGACKRLCHYCVHNNFNCTTSHDKLCHKWRIT